MSRLMLSFCSSIALAAVAFVSFPSVCAASTCTKPFLMRSQARVKKIVAAKRVARKKVQRRATRRCRGTNLVFLSRWAYQCKRSKGLFFCKAQAKFRCCGKKALQTAKRKRRRLTVKERRKLAFKRNLIRRKKRLALAKKRRYRLAVSKAKRKRARRVARSFKGKLCRDSRVSIKGYSREKTKKIAMLEARGAARIRALERCGQMWPVWMKNWHYQCAKSGSRFVCSAFSAVRCCKE